MTYDPSVPQDIDIISISQGDLLNNFTQLNTVFSVDHVAYNASANRGKHNKVTLRSQGNDPTTDAPATITNEMAIFALDEGADTEMYFRGQSNATVVQATRNNELFIRIYPVYAVNMDNTSPNPVISSSFNHASVTRLDGAKAHFQLNFTNAVTDSAGNPTNNYMWSMSAFDNSSNPVVAQVPNGGTFSSRVGNNFIRVICKNQNNTTLTNITRLVVVCWKVQ